MNNIVEQNHHSIKKTTNQIEAFEAFYSTQSTLTDIKLCPSKIINSKIMEYTHKHHKEEVFVLGLFVINETKSMVRCFFNSKHKHYSDVTNVPHLLNPMLLLECCRQAETYIVHQLFSVDESTKFLLKNWRLDIVKENYERFHSNNYHSIDIYVETSNASNATSNLRENNYDFLVQIEGVIIAKARFDVRYVNDICYSIIRGNVFSSGHCEYSMMPRLTPSLVGYKSSYNSILSNFEECSGRYQALVNINSSNTTYVDHYQDHVTGMNIAEAAKQFCFCYLSKVLGINSDEYQMVALEANYYLYVELYSYAYIIEEVCELSGDDYHFILNVVQDDQVKSKCEIRLTKF